MRFFALTRFVLLLAGVAIVAGGCSDERDPIPPPGPEADGREYYPMEVGRFWEYEVVEHHWDFNTDSASTYRIREEVDTVYTGAAGERVFHLVRYRQNGADTLSVWRPDSARDIVLTAALVRRTANNVPTVELRFPVREGRGWDPNAYNAGDSTQRAYSAVDRPVTLQNGRTFERTLRVVDEPQVSAVENRQQESVYAWNLGCVYRRRTVLDYCNQSEVNQGLCQLGSGYIVRGSEREEQLRRWGRR